MAATVWRQVITNCYAILADELPLRRSIHPRPSFSSALIVADRPVAASDWFGSNPPLRAWVRLARPQPVRFNLALANTRATVVCVHVVLPRGDCTPPAVSVWARPARVMIPSARSASTSSTSRYAAAPPPPASHGPQQRHPGRRHGSADAHHQIIRPRLVRGTDGDAILQELREGVGAAGDSVQPGGDQDRAQLPASSQGCLEARPAIALTAGDVGKFTDRGPAPGGDKGPNAGLLRFQAETAVALLGRGDAGKGDGVVRLRAEQGGQWSASIAFTISLLLARILAAAKLNVAHSAGQTSINLLAEYAEQILPVLDLWLRLIGQSNGSSPYRKRFGY